MAPRGRAQGGGMNRPTPLVLPLVVLVAFTAFSLWVVATEGLLGFVPLLRGEPWAVQFFLDIAIACTLYGTWMARDARQRGLPFAPYLVAMLLAGSIGALAYLVHRGLAARSARTGRAAALA